MKIETSDKPLTRSKYEGHLDVLKDGKTLINLEYKFYKGLRSLCYKRFLNLDYRIITKKQVDGKYSIRLAALPKD